MLLFRSSSTEVFCTKSVLKNFGKIHRTIPVPESFFNKVADFRRATLSKKRLWHRCFPVNFAKFLKTPFLTDHLRWLLLNQWKQLWIITKKISVRVGFIFKVCLTILGRYVLKSYKNFLFEYNYYFINNQYVVTFLSKCF